SVRSLSCVFVMGLSDRAVSAHWHKRELFHLRRTQTAETYRRSSMKTLHCLIARLRPAFPNLVNRIAIPSLVAAAALALVQPCGAAPFQWEETGSLDIARL